MTGCLGEQVGGFRHEEVRVLCRGHGPLAPLWLSFLNAGSVVTELLAMGAPISAVSLLEDGASTAYLSPAKDPRLAWLSVLSVRMCYGKPSPYGQCGLSA